MRQIFTLISCLAILVQSNAQVADAQSIFNFRFRCSATPIKEEPLYIINGIPAEKPDLQKLNPDDIESIWVLKNAQATALYGYRAAHGVVIITTKTAYQSTIQVKDMLTGEPLIGSSIEIISIGARKDTMHFVTDTTGRVVIDKIIPGKDYQLRVSNTGYTSFVSTINSKLVGKNHTVLLPSEFKTLDEVTIKAYKFSLKPNRFDYRCFSLDKILCGQLRCVMAGVKIIPETPKEIKSYQIHDFKIYPNPVLRSQKVNIELTSDDVQKISLKLFGLSGNLISTNEFMFSKGINRLSYAIDVKIGAGIYVIQLLDQRNQLIRSEKLLIQ